MSVSKRLRYEILRRDNHACRYCGATAPDAVLTVDHVIPVALGGTDEPSNLTTACHDCNIGKSASSPDAETVENVSADALRWAAAMRDAAETLAGDQWNRDSYRLAFKEVWGKWGHEVYGIDQVFHVPESWPLTIDALVRSGLTRAQMLDAVSETMLRNDARDRWRYFCGVAWKTVSRMQDIALTLLAAETGESNGAD